MQTQRKRENTLLVQLSNICANKYRLPYRHIILGSANFISKNERFFSAQVFSQKTLTGLKKTLARPIKRTWSTLMKFCWYWTEDWPNSWNEALLNIPTAKVEKWYFFEVVLTDFFYRYCNFSANVFPLLLEIRDRSSLTPRYQIVSHFSIFTPFTLLSSFIGIHLFLVWCLQIKKYSQFFYGKWWSKSK